uniref:Reverse transcriptase Ty1/copia-type domain-containing protein n=1 Tax=Physcomitrium patens TaxID=3218 RepID=A0A2K1K5L0_PHYPA|nr:hypothetical protein PHYPA_010955 [Physcomitrium patens]
MPIEFSNYHRNEGIKHQLSMVHTPQKNDINKYKNRTIIEHTRSIATIILRAWYRRINKYVTNQELKRNQEDFNMYFLITRDKYIIILFYVDDTRVTRDDKHNI